MADLAETRKFCVQSLRKAAKKCGVPLVRDSASRAKVEEFAQAVLDSDGPGEEKTAAERALEAYLATWPTEGDDEEEEEEEQEEEDEEGTGFRLRGRSFLLTYN